MLNHFGESALIDRGRVDPENEISSYQRRYGSSLSVFYPSDLEIIKEIVQPEAIGRGIHEAIT